MNLIDPFIFESTKSQKLFRVSPLKNYIVSQLDNSQSIRRLTRYLTQTPLLNRGMTYDGKRLDQPDLKDSLLESVSTDTQASVATPILIPYPFNEETIHEHQVSIYVYSPRTSFSQSAKLHHTNQPLGKHHFYIDIITPMIYEEVSPFQQQRSLLIGCAVLDLLDGAYVDSELEKVIGRCQFILGGDITTHRLSKTGYLITTIPLTVISPMERVDAYQLER